MSSRGANGLPSESTACITWLSWMPFSQEMDFRFMIRSTRVPFPQKTASHLDSKISSALFRLPFVSFFSIDGSTPVMVHHKWRSRRLFYAMAANDGEHQEVVNSR